MAEHLHTQIAEAVKVVLESSAVGSIGGRAFGRRVYPGQQTELPYGCTWVPREEVQRESGAGGTDTGVESLAEVLIALFYEGEEGELESLMNAGMLEVQIALAPGVQLSSGLVHLDFKGVDKTFERGDVPYGEVLLRYNAEIAYDAGDPTRLAW